MKDIDYIISVLEKKNIRFEQISSIDEYLLLGIGLFLIVFIILLIEHEERER